MIEEIEFINSAEFYPNFGGSKFVIPIEERFVNEIREARKLFLIKHGQFPTAINIGELDLKKLNDGKKFDYKTLLLFHMRFKFNSSIRPGKWYLSQDK